MGHFEMMDLVSVIGACTTARAAGRLVSMAKAVEELRVLTGDFISPDEIVANALSPVAWERGCAVLFDEQPGADILHTPWQEA
ncbi:MAG: hypothetical protein EOS57_16250 [Mesorhizobium sp.]|uniref:hypothetical protein n=1 Tax=Mesorhizobium sp. TaxID=1871066 RepID=UPI000FE53BE6|nr:hypothetical protein [Mesorhizobium sp.]RWB34366.1 MAG: hypothetical protein EOQ43_01585 [Mesorhizobium sp.]RWC35266.1 MAG: hypothetical protein EOS70_09330 [Mesorhizobium sp.]RWD18631.1 MAG: hypothetical protein EOS57_16250 [Mesorhizobium sp.]TIU78383.1 MAG: hypothetical protein E5W13_11375 [Mesorhizobium sp.]